MLASLNKIDAVERRIGKMLPGASAGAPARETRSFLRFIADVFPRYRFYTYARQLIRALEAVERGDLTRLMVFMPPRHGKSEIISRLFPAWLLRRHPSLWVGLTSYGQNTANGFSRRARDYYRDSGGTLSEEAAGVKEWETGARGGLWASGIGGPLTGKGFHVGIIDDPIKNAEEAASPTVRAKHKQWYDSTFYTRREPGAAVIIVQTRWHPDDLSGWLLSRERKSNDPEEWHMISMDALHEAPPDVPASCTVASDWRSPGEALAPRRYSRTQLQKTRATITSKSWSSLYQQKPTDTEGALWSWGMIERAERPAHFDRVVIGVDPAGGGGDEHGIIVVGRAGSTAYVLQDGTEAGTASPNTWATAVSNLYDHHQADRVVAEVNFGGDMVASTLRSVRPSLPVTVVRASRGKAVRAEPIAALYETGRVMHCGELTKLEQQMTSWDPQHDKSSPDRVDALVWALTDLMLDAQRDLTYISWNDL